MLEPGDVSMDQWRPDSTNPGIRPEPNSKAFMGQPGFLGKEDKLIKKTVGDNYSFVLRMRGDRPLNVTLYQMSPFESKWVFIEKTTINHGFLGCIVEFPIRSKYSGRLKLRYVAENSKGKIPLEQDLHVFEAQLVNNFSVSATLPGLARVAIQEPTLSHNFSVPYIQPKRQVGG